MGKYIDADLLRKEIDKWVEAMADAVGEYSDGVRFALQHFTFVLDSLQQEQKEVDLEKFTEKMDAWKARYNYPDNIIVKGAMAFTARMFYMYPNIAREWYDSLPEVTMD